MWKTVKLGDVCDFQNGFAFKSAFFKENGKPILRISNIQNEKIDTRKTVYFDAKDYDTDFTRYEVKPDDLLIAMSGATTGKIGFNKTDTTYYLNQRVGNLKPKPPLDKVFLYYLLFTKVQENLSISKGAAQPNLSSEQIKNISFSLPPLVEQQRIVAKLDAAFAEIDGAIEVANAKEAEVQKLEGSLLSSSLGGNAMMSEIVKLGDICLVTDYVANGSFKSLSDNVKYLTGDGYAILVRLTDFTKGWNGNYKYVDKAAYNFLAKTKLFHGDLLISNVGEPGKTFLVPELGKPMTLAPNSILVRPDSDILNTGYLKYFIDSSFGKACIKGIESGTTQRKFNKTEFRNLEISLPPLAEQQRIVAKLDAAFTEIENANNSIIKCKANYLALKTSILAQELRSEAA